MADHPQDLPPDAKVGGLNAEALFAVGFAGQRNSGGGSQGWTPPTVEELQRALPQYEISGMLGRGGMGAVYKGVQRSLDRVVAIKILPSGIEEGDVHYSERFKMEAKSMARLSHPGIVAVFDAGETAPSASGLDMSSPNVSGQADGLLYFVMEFVEGTDVQQMIAQGPLPPEHALAIAAHVCDALGFAHESGIVHRDIKPANIMVDARGHVKVADFGLAKVTTQESGGFTRTNLVMGTPDFMAPETRTSAAHVDHRADLYAVGVMLYAMLTGEIPRGRFALPSMTVPGLDPRFDAIVDKAMQADREQRYASAAALRGDLDRLLTAPIPVDAPLPGRSKVPWLIAAAVVAMLAAGGFAWKSRPVGAMSPQASALEPGAIKLWDSAETIPKLAGIRWEDGVLRIDGTAARYSATISRDAIIRAEIRMNPGKETRQLSLRYRPGEPRTDSYRVQVSPQASTVILDSMHSGKTTELHRWRLPRTYGPDEWLRVELRAIGDELTVSADGEVLGSVQDTSLPQPGGVQLFAVADGYFRNIVYVPLDKPGSAGPSAPAKKVAASYPQPAQWIDATNEVGRKLVATKIAVLEGDALRIVKSPCAVPLADGREFHNAVVRMVCSQHAFLFLRKGGTAYYSAHWGINGSGSVDYTDTAQNAARFLKHEGGIPRADFDADAEHELVFAAQDDRLTLWIDGVEKATLRDSTLARGKIGLQLNAVDADAGNVRIRKIEYAELPDTLQATATFATATKDAPFVNSLGIKFVPVPITGGPTDGQRVLFSVWETRVQDYEVFARETTRTWPSPGFSQSPAHPAVSVSAEDGQAFCLWLTARERKAGKLAANERYRLPTDHEWSCAVGIGDREDAAKLATVKNRKLPDVSPWGSGWPPPAKAGNYAGEELQPALAAGKYSYIKGGVIDGYRDGQVETAPVASFPPNSVGLYDLSGNAWEWCEGSFDASPTDGVLRGGSWAASDRLSLLSSARLRYVAAARHGTNGFRVVLTAGNSVAAAISPPPSESTFATATKAAPFVNSLGMKFVPVPITGGPTDGQRVLFSVWETRVQDYEVFVLQTKHEWTKPAFLRDASHPAINVSWEDAQAFCVWLTDREHKSGQLGASERYRLPGDHEWSCAVDIGEREDPAKIPAERRGDMADVFPWGTAWPPPPGAGNYSGEEVAGHEWTKVQGVLAGYRDDFPQTAPVASFTANGLGLFDLGGNALEWCEDWFDREQQRRVLRGASFASVSRVGLLSSGRAGGGEPTARVHYYGFRCVVSGDAAKAAAGNKKP